MKKITFALSAVSVAIALSLVSTSAMAYSSASASITNLAFTLTDLDPFDEITPSLNLYNYYDNYYGYDQSYVSGYAANSMGESSSFTNYGDPYTSGAITSFSPVTGSAALSNAYATATVGANSLSAAGLAIGFDNGNYAYFGATSSPTYYSSYFTLSPQTSVTFTGDTNVAAASSSGTIYNGEYANAEGYLVAYVYDGNNNYLGTAGSYSNLQSYNGNQFLYNYDSANNNYTYDNAFAGNSFSSVINATLTNNSTNEATGYLYSYASVNGYSYSSTSPVPEPETYAMLLSGLGLMSFVARRKNKSNQA